MITGYTTGVYDLFHIGHLRLLERAKEHCDRLVVGVTTDQLSLAVKGKTPVIPFDERRAIVSALSCVDEVVPQTSMNKREAWEAVRFDVMFVGDDWRGTPKWVALEEEFASLGVRIEYFAYTDHTSSTLLRAALSTLQSTGRSG
ncbi:adenylyltransferase/cytidyltransferase family protein [Streptomyces sp. NP160]|uniref:adenylyltransferase/cytidyltransferase family protein n=1 Tax=Streptomyces sp. NP160 TaxID=2586637 RepID=UPI00111ACD76|nr:adenylyltransferase/cytidyltransferase family protein [Streptomyces sp. NP160]TNM61044.1 adenylyltransferase/cytidyltransferase family protein [Streptomyces sp. NP160]